LYARKTHSGQKSVAMFTRNHEILDRMKARESSWQSKYLVYWHQGLTQSIQVNPVRHHTARLSCGIPQRPECIPYSLGGVISLDFFRYGGQSIPFGQQRAIFGLAEVGEGDAV
jgi:hypothetical protein